MSNPTKKAQPAERVRARFTELRSKILAATAKFDQFDSALRAHYGTSYQPSWVKVGERNTLERLRAARSRAGDAFTKHLASFSPRDWDIGVPIHWVWERLTYEDAARPLGEPLSVRPPLAYGATRHMT